MRPPGWARSQSSACASERACRVTTFSIVPSVAFIEGSATTPVSVSAFAAPLELWRSFPLRTTEGRVDQPADSLRARWQVDLFPPPVVNAFEDRRLDPHLKSFGLRCHNYVRT